MNLVFLKNVGLQYYPFDKTLIELLINNKSLTSLNLCDNNGFKKAFDSYYSSLLKGLKYNTTLTEL